ncbi:uroporphyrinogen-III C-methyltransferase [Shouchella shacheensis]|uniref:uroporphyrinogen-III C-methyltransferase n=1 Tax=Shouchella shacheensis TaxID=1649580 RepID=UPI00074020C6|nr:uroporphyrinogen-III C-methyltransferase [Shouchella shacheensis]
MSRNGHVYLVGAGPGDAGLLTAKGVACLQKADVVLYDRLVNPLLLEETKPEAKLIYAGKLPKRHHLRQEVIHDELVRHALAGKSVVRLKGGDPSVFGRVGEEAEFLDRYEISYDIVPGVTSGIAAPAYAGVPVTHREHGASFAVATGHSKTTSGEPELDWEGLAKIDTVAFYMGVKNLPTISEKLMEQGRDADEPVMLIQWGSTSKQRTLLGTLSTIAEKVRETGFENPAITLVGQVGQLYQKKSWFERKPLFGHHVLVARGGAASEHLAERLQEEGAEVFHYPRVETIASTPPTINWEEYEALAFEQAKDVQCFFSWLQQTGVDIRTISARFEALSAEAEVELSQRGLVVEKNPELDVKRLFLGSAEFPSSERTVIQTHVSTPVSSSNTTCRRLLEEGRIDQILFTDAESVKTLLRALAEDSDLEQRLAPVPKICVTMEARLAASQAGLTAVRAERSSANPVENWLEAFADSEVKVSAGHSVRRPWEPCEQGE